MDKNEYTLNFLREMLGGGKVPDYSEQEQAALCGRIPMTMEIFQSCLETCIAAGNIVEFMDLFEQFPEQGQVWAAELHKELDAVSASLEAQDIELSDEDIQVGGRLSGTV